MRNSSDAGRRAGAEPCGSQRRWRALDLSMRPPPRRRWVAELDTTEFARATTSIIAQIGDNERTGIVAAIDRRERASPPRASTEPLRELFEFGNRFGGPHGLHPRRENDLIPHITGGIQD